MSPVPVLADGAQTALVESGPVVATPADVFVGAEDARGFGGSGFIAGGRIGPHSTHPPHSQKPEPQM